MARRVPRAFVAAAGALHLVAALFASGVARSDPATLRADSAPKLVGGAALAVVGGGLTIAGAWPCPSGQDCSTRGLGVAVGAPVLLSGGVLVSLGVRDRANAVAIERAPLAAEERERLTSRGRVELIAAATTFAVGAAAAGYGLLALERGCRHPCTTGDVVTYGGLGALALSIELAALGHADLRASKAVQLTPLAAPTALGVAASSWF